MEALGLAAAVAAMTAFKWEDPEERKECRLGRRSKEAFPPMMGVARLQFPVEERSEGGNRGDSWRG